MELTEKAAIELYSHLDERKHRILKMAYCLANEDGRDKVHDIDIINAAHEVSIEDL